MKSALAVAIVTVGLSLNCLFAQQVDNADFAKGKVGWLGDGKIVYMNDADEISDTPQPGFVPCLKVDLNKNSWQEVKQTFRAKSNETDIQFSVKVKASPDFERAAESNDYTKDNDFEEGGNYSWSALVAPKCDFLVRVKDSTWYYRLFSLKPVGSWKSITTSFPKLKSQKREFSLLFPPGTGSVYLKGN